MAPRFEPSAAFGVSQIVPLGLLALTYVAAAAPLLRLAVPLPAVHSLERMLPVAMGLATGVTVYGALAVAARRQHIRWLVIIPVVVAGVAATAYAGQVPWVYGVTTVNGLVGFSMSVGM